MTTPATAVTRERHRFAIRLLLWALLAAVGISGAIFVFLGVTQLNHRKRIMADAFATFGWRAVQREGHYPLWARSLIGADRIPNGWETVTVISFDDSDVSDDDLANVAANLQRFPDVRALGLDNTKITDDGLEHLKQLSNLKIITLSGTQVTDTGVAKLQRALPRLVIHK
jgi:hypothetical protein